MVHLAACFAVYQHVLGLCWLCWLYKSRWGGVATGLRAVACCACVLWCILAFTLWYNRKCGGACCAVCAVLYPSWQTHCLHSCDCRGRCRCHVHIANACSRLQGGARARLSHYSRQGLLPGFAAIVQPLAFSICLSTACMLALGRIIFIFHRLGGQAVCLCSCTAALHLHIFRRCIADSVLW